MSTKEATKIRVGYNLPEPLVTRIAVKAASERKHNSEVVERLLKRGLDAEQQDIGGGRKKGV